MGIYIYTLIGKRDIKGTEVFRANFSQRLSSLGWDSPRTVSKEQSILEKHSNTFETEPLFVFGFNHLEKVYKKANCNGYFYDCDEFGEHIGWLMKVGRGYQVITTDELDEHVRNTSAFNDFADLIKSTGSHYRPTIRTRDSHMNVVLADIFDQHYNDTGPWIDPDTKEISTWLKGWDYQNNCQWKAQTQAYRG